MNLLDEVDKINRTDIAKQMQKRSYVRILL